MQLAGFSLTVSFRPSLNKFKMTFYDVNFQNGRANVPVSSPAVHAFDHAKDLHVIERVGGWGREPI